MTTEQNSIPEPTSTEVVVGKINGQTVIPKRVDYRGLQWEVEYPTGVHIRMNWPALRRALTNICVVDLARIFETIRYIQDLEASVAHPSKNVTEPGPWLTGDELKVVLPTLKAGDAVEVRGRGDLGDFSGELRTGIDAAVLTLAGWCVRSTRGGIGATLDALRIIERAPAHREVWHSGDDVGDLVRICKMTGARVDVSHVDGLGVTGPVQYVDTAGMDVGSDERGYRVMFHRAGWTITATAPEPEPEPGADIPDEVVEAAASAYAEGYDEYTYSKLDRDEEDLGADYQILYASRGEAAESWAGYDFGPEPAPDGKALCWDCAEKTQEGESTEGRCEVAAERR